MDRCACGRLAIGRVTAGAIHPVVPIVEPDRQRQAVARGEPDRRQRIRDLVERARHSHELRLVELARGDLDVRRGIVDVRADAVAEKNL